MSRSARHGVPRRGEHRVVVQWCRFSSVRRRTSDECELAFQDCACYPSISGIRIDESSPAATNDAAKPTGERARPTLAPSGRGSCGLQQDPAAERGTKGTLIRHAGIGSASAILALTVPVIESSFGALLVAAIGAAPLLPISLLAAQRAAVALSPVAVAADPKHFAASAASAKALT